VLNALRHQRFVGSAGHCSGSNTSRAQRLAASEVWRVVQPEWACPKSSWVLNALRHQRFGGFWAPSGNNQMECWCSTPCGIRGLAAF